MFRLLTADFAAAVVLISMGAMLGKLSPVQYLIMAFIETPVAIFIEHHVVHTFHVSTFDGRGVSVVDQWHESKGHTPLSQVCCAISPRTLLFQG